ncbi:MAG: hypothetical protein FJ368_01155 [Pelagibacterales bacterium]|nr:hypothetical protein [Pelagibacterales bacterium]
MIVFFWILAACSSLILITAAIAFFRTKEIFTMINVVMISNCYVIPLVLIAANMENFSWQSFMKVFFLVLINLIITNLLCNLILKKASE